MRIILIDDRDAFFEDKTSCFVLMVIFSRIEGTVSDGRMSGENYAVKGTLV